MLLPKCKFLCLNFNEQFVKFTTSSVWFRTSRFTFNFRTSKLDHERGRRRWNHQRLKGDYPKEKCWNLEKESPTKKGKTTHKGREMTGGQAHRENESGQATPNGSQ